jgi:AP-3 complex subunit sigma
MPPKLFHHVHHRYSIAMIRAILVFNNHGKPRLLKFYEYFVSRGGGCSARHARVLQPDEEQQQIVRETFQLVSKRDDNVCNFLESGR